MPPRRPWRLDFLPHPTTPLQNQPDPPCSLHSALTPIHPRSTSQSVSSATSAISLLPLSSTSSSLSPAPPPRLHLRSLIPSPPSSPQFLANVPPEPYPWTWRCHLCNRQYALGVTRRCLEDGHYFCSLPSPPPSPVEDFDEPPESIDDYAGGDMGMGGLSEMTAGEQAIEKLQRAKQIGRSKRKRRLVKGCRAEFDYQGWWRYNLWRREVRLFQQARQEEYEGKAKGKGRRGDEYRGRRERGIKRDCWCDCNFPSACQNERKAERERLELERRRGRELEKKLLRSYRENDIQEPAVERGIPKQRKKDRELRMNSADAQTEPGNPSPTQLEPKLEPKPQSALELDTGDIATASGDAESRSNLALDVPVEGMGPMGIDCDGLGEEGYLLEYAKSRRKSLGATTPPSSPLKSTFNLENVEVGNVARCKILEESAGKKKQCGNCKQNNISVTPQGTGCLLCGHSSTEGQVEGESEFEEADLQMQEVLRARSLFLRSFGGGDMFGDEEDENIL